MSAWLFWSCVLGFCGSLSAWRYSGKRSKASWLMCGQLGCADAWLPLVGVLLCVAGVVFVILYDHFLGEMVSAILCLILVWGIVAQLAKWLLVLRVGAHVITAYSEGVARLRRFGEPNVDQLPDSITSIGRVISLPDIVGFESGEYKVFVSRKGILVKWQCRGEDIAAEVVVKKLLTYTEVLHRMIAERCPPSGPHIMKAEVGPHE
jgi:hypothetical protein